MALSNLGIFHTLIGIIAIVSALISFIKYSKINLAESSGKVYYYGTIIASLTALGISKHGGFNPGHAFAIFILILVWIAYFLHARRKGNNRARYIENFLLSFSFFLSMVPTVNETYQRIPLNHPLAKTPADPSIKSTLLVLFILLIVGSVYQFIRQRRINKSADKVSF